MIEFVENCWFLEGNRLGPFYFGRKVYHSKGTVASVDFDWEKALDHKVIGWYHTHPGVNFLTPSSTDHETMRSWVKTTARPMLCGIMCQGRHKCYRFHRASRKWPVLYSEMPVILIGSFFFGVATSGSEKVSV